MAKEDFLDGFSGGGGANLGGDIKVPNALKKRGKFKVGSGAGNLDANLARKQGGQGGTKGSAGANLTGIASPPSVAAPKLGTPLPSTKELTDLSTIQRPPDQEFAGPTRSFDDIVSARAARTGMPITNEPQRPTLGGGTLRDHKGRDFTASGKKTGDGFIPRGATGADGQPIERGGGTMSVTSTPDSALDYEAQVAADFGQRRAAQAERLRQGREESVRRHQANKTMEDARKRIDSAQFLGEVPNPIDVEIAKAGAGMLGDVGDIAQANIAAGVDASGDATSAALAAARIGQKSASDLAGQGLKERRFAFDAAKEQQRMSEASQGRELAQQRFGLDTANTVSQMSRRGEQTRLGQAGFEEGQKQSGIDNLQSAFKTMSSIDYMNATPRQREALLVNAGLTPEQANFLMERGEE